MEGDVFPIAEIAVGFVFDDGTGGGSGRTQPGMSVPLKEAVEGGGVAGLGEFLITSAAAEFFTILPQ